MFVLSSVSDTLRIPPRNLNVSVPEALTLEIQRIYIDKVVKDLGLCITLYDINSVEGGFVFAGDGAPTFTVTFRLVMFRPFVGEVLVGKLKRSDKTVSLGFFEDIRVPEYLLPQPSVFMEAESVWVWKYEDQEMYMDLEEEVRFRVSSVKYPPIPLEQEKDAKPFAPMEIIGDINGEGLGLVAWW